MPASLKLTWVSDGVSVAGFVVQRKNPTTAVFEEAGRTAATVKTFTDSTLLFSKPYTFRVAAFNSEGNLGPFLEGSATTSAEPLPHAPTNLTVVAL